MIIKAKTQHATIKREFDFEIPDNPHDRFGAFWTFATFEVLSAIEARLSTYTIASYRHIREYTHPAIDGRFIKMVIEDMTVKGVLVADGNGDVKEIRGGWQSAVGFPGESAA